MSEEPTATGEELPRAAVSDSNEVENQTDQDKQVPLSALESERSKRQQLEEDNRLMKEHFALIDAQRSQKQPNKKDDFDGLEDDDVLTVAEFKKISSKMRGEFSTTIDELLMMQKYPDYEQVITKHLPKVLKNNPKLRKSLEMSQDYELAYYLAKNSNEFRESNPDPAKVEQAERIVKNMESTGSLSSMGGSTSVGDAKRYSQMSDEEFEEIAYRNLGK